MKTPPKPAETTHAQRFDTMLTGLFSVSKTEILRREAEYKKQRALRKKSR